MSPDHITRLVTAALQGADAGATITIGCIIYVQGNMHGHPDFKKLLIPNKERNRE